MEKEKDNVYDEYIKESKLQMQQHQTSDNEDDIYSHYVVDATTQEEINISENQYDFFTNFKSDTQEIEIKKKK